MQLRIRVVLVRDRLQAGLRPALHGAKPRAHTGHARMGWCGAGALARGVIPPGLKPRDKARRFPTAVAVGFHSELGFLTRYPARFVCSRPERGGMRVARHFSGGNQRPGITKSCKDN